MSEKKKASRNTDADQSPEAVVDGPSGLARLEEAVKRILKVPKEAIDERADND